MYKRYGWWRGERDGEKSMQIKKVFRPINPKNIKNLSADVPSLFSSLVVLLLLLCILALRISQFAIKKWNNKNARRMKMYNFTQLLLILSLHHNTILYGKENYNFNFVLLRR